MKVAQQIFVARRIWKTETGEDREGAESRFKPALHLISASLPSQSSVPSLCLGLHRPLSRNPPLNPAEIPVFIKGVCKQE